jgi:hypothetical protein
MHGSGLLWRGGEGIAEQSDVPPADRMKNRHKAKATAARGPWKDDYWFLSTRPLHGLAFLLPLIVLYELGSIFYLTDHAAGVATRIKAEKMLGTFFESFGISVILIPGLMIVTVLFIWHLVAKDRWKVKPQVVGLMGLESAAWVFPLVLMAAIVTNFAIRLATGHGAPAASEHTTQWMHLAAAGGELSAMSWQARLSISLGAGLYEELVFRLILISVVHAILRDLLELKPWIANLVSIATSALAFAFYHDATIAGGVINWPSLAFYTAAGAYFAWIFMWRGFGIVVGTHALYDVAVLIIFNQS